MSDAHTHPGPPSARGLAGPPLAQEPALLARETTNALGSFLRARRELVTPGEAGIPDGGVRRVPGLRREEVAMLAGISADYYLRLEQGRDRNPSAQVLDALARVLRLDDVEAAYLHDLAAPRPRSRPRRRPPERVPERLHHLLAALDVPAFVEGRAFANTQSDYDSFEAGSAFRPSSLEPFALRLDSFESRFDPDTLQSRDFTARVTVTEPGADPVADTIKVNHPLEVGGAKVYLQGNGYAPQVTVRDAAGEVAFAGAVPFLPQDTVYTSQGVIKVPDVTTGPQIGLQGVLLPTAQQLSDDIWRSVDPQPTEPLLALAVWTGDLGLDDGIPQNVYQLDESGLTQATQADGRPVTLYVRPGQTVDLPDGLGTLTFDALPRFVALDLRHDPSLAWVLTFALLAFAGLAASLFAPRRRVWLRASPAPEGDEGPGSGRTVVTAAALARGDDVGLQAELDRAVDRLRPAGGDLPAAG